jgi:hypothetical protein
VEQTESQQCENKNKYILMRDEQSLEDGRKINSAAQLR